MGCNYCDNRIRCVAGYVAYKRIFILSVLICLAGRVFAQDMRADILEVKYLYDDLRFEEAIITGRGLLEDLNSVDNPEQLAFVHHYMGFSFYQLSQIDSARSHFLSLLSIAPETELDALTTSPKVLTLFEQIKTDFRKLRNDVIYIPYTSYVFLDDKRPGAAWRSALIPGWGQYYKGQATRAYIMGGTFALSALTLITSALKENSYRKKYLDSTNPSEISNLYNTYNDWSRMRQVSTYTTIGIWLLVFADALWMEPAEIRLGLSLSRLQDTFSITFSHAF